MCDLTDVTSLTNVIGWIGDIFDNCHHEDVTIIVIANKCDMFGAIDQNVVAKLETDIE